MIFFEALKELPLIAIIRGLPTDRVLKVSEILLESGIRALEVTMNSPSPFHSIEALVSEFGEQAVIGAGTVTTIDQVQGVYEAGGSMILSPNTDVSIIQKTKQNNMVSIPGIFTPSEAFRALDAGADVLKMFPADALNLAAISGMKAVLPRNTKIFAVGGVCAATIPSYHGVGVDGFGIGSSLVKLDKTLSNIKLDALEIIKTYKQVQFRESL